MNYKPIQQLNLFLDLQYRKVDYRYFGLVDSSVFKMQDANFNFFNPKIGASYNLNASSNVYASFAIGNKEPNGDDLTKNYPINRPGAETMYNTELGYRLTKNKISFNTNLYYMQYFNQLVLNGEIDNVGNPKRLNVSNSYRRGIELELSYQPIKQIGVLGNISLSQNKITNFKEVISRYDASFNGLAPQINNYNLTDISFSPSMVSSAQLIITPIKKLEIAIIQKYVGRQYLDNTSNVKRSINPYNTFDLRFNYVLPIKSIKEITLMATVFNILNAQYETNGYTYSYYVDNVLTTKNFLSPAAPTYFLGGLSIKF
jgi:iron complex outermembrane receptor protein